MKTFILGFALGLGMTAASAEEIDRAFQACKAKRGDGFFCKDAKCSNN